MTELRQPTPEQWAEVQRLCEVASPAPWTADNMETREDGSPGNAWGVESHGTPERMGQIVVLHDFVNEANAKFIAAARTALPDAIAEIGRLSQALAASEARWQALKAWNKGSLRCLCGDLDDEMARLERP